MTTEITESHLNVDLHFLDHNNIKNYANELNKKEGNSGSIKSIDHNMNDENIIFVQETRKFNLFCTFNEPCQEEFDSHNDPAAFLELFAHNLSILFDKIRFSEEFCMTLR